MKKLITLAFILSILNGLSQEIILTPYATGFSSPLNIQNAGDNRLFIVEQGGRIKIINADGTVNPTSFLDISGQISSGGERGLLGLAFHPDYANNGYFFVYYTKPNGDSQVSRFTVDGSDPDLADSGSELPLFDITQPFSNHNGGCIAFGPDGYLYIATGDGGSGGDPGDRAQNTTLLLGKLLRIDVDNPGGGNNYGIPADNPFAGSSTDAQEIWAYGLRNSWKFSFDRETGDLWIADVGQNAIEEINHEPSTTPGLNYGWRCYEGSQTFNTTDCPDPSTLTFPVAEYPHSVGSSITGGYVYRGSNYENLIGIYIFADFVSGILGTVDASETLTNLGDYGQNWASFGEDVNGEMYLAGFNGTIYSIESTPLIGFDDHQAISYQLFPNPAAGEVTLQGAVPLNHIAIYNIQGSLIIDLEVPEVNTHTLSTEMLPAGLYLIKVKGLFGGTSTQKLIIK